MLCGASSAKFFTYISDNTGYTHIASWNCLKAMGGNSGRENVVLLKPLYK